MRALLALLAVLVCGAASAQQPAKTPNLRRPEAVLATAPTGMEMQFLPQADQVSFDGTYLVLDGVSPMIPFFVDRPLRVTGVITPEQFGDIWALSEASLKLGPAVATIAVMSANRTPSPIAELHAVTVSGNRMVFEARMISGQLPDATGPVTLMFRPRMWWPRWRDGKMAGAVPDGPSGPEIACYLTLPMNQSICRGITMPMPVPTPVH